MAREAGVSLATVDRVVNRRPGVRAQTVERVERAIARIDYRANAAAATLARGRHDRFAFVLPLGANSFMANLADQVARSAPWLDTQHATIDSHFVDVFDPQALAGALLRLPAHYSGVAVVALDHPLVRTAIDNLAARGVAVVTLVSDAPGARRAHYVGIDNPAAGRTAATLIGRFVGAETGSVGILAGSLSLRDHAERVFGFRQVLSTEFPHLAILPVLEGRDDSARNETIVGQLLAQHTDLRALYSVGAGNRGVAAALEASGRARQIVWVAHELTVHTRGFLLSGTADAIINQNPGHEARSAARVLLATCRGMPIIADQEQIRVEIFIRDNLP